MTCVGFIQIVSFHDVDDPGISDNVVCVMFYMRDVEGFQEIINT